VSGANALAYRATPAAVGNALAGGIDPQYLQWLHLASQHVGVAPNVLHSMVQNDPDAPWVQNLKRLVDPSVDPRALVAPQYQNTDPGLNRTGPVVGEVLGT
jgi:hypothetical protein